MFERYTEKARRVIFFARYEASQFGQTEIGDLHLLLGLLREHKELVHRYFRGPGGTLTFEEAVRKENDLRRKIEEAIGVPGEKVSTSMDVPLSNPAKRILAYAAEEAERMNHRHIGTEHLFLGLLREKGCLAASILEGEGIELTSTRERMAAAEPEATVVTPPELRGGNIFAVGSGSAGGFGSDRAGITGGRAHRAGILEFLCDGAVVASVVVLVVSPIPRVGERVVLKDKDGGDVAYRVEELTYKYERYPPDMAVAPHQLAKLVVRVKRE